MFSLFTPERSAPATLGMALFGAGLVASLLFAATPNRAQAAAACRSDPIVFLSNGVVLDLSAAIIDDVSDVQSISYTLHAPQGVSLLSSISTDGPVGYKEKFKFKADSKLSGPAGVYEVEMQVKTGSKNITVTATIAGGDAGTLGITPSMVSPGATSFAPVDGNDAQKHDAKGPNAPAALPTTVTDALNTWAQSAAWAVTASATSTTDKGLDTAIAL